MFELAQFIAACRKALRSSDASATVQAIVREVVSDPSSIATAPGQASSEGTAQYIFLHQSAHLTVLQVITPPRFQSPPHNHLVWAVIGLYEGCETNTFYRRHGPEIRKETVRDVKAPGTIVLVPDAIHAIANPVDRSSYALHVYGGTLANPARSIWNPVTLQEEPFQREALSRYEKAMNSLAPLR